MCIYKFLGDVSLDQLRTTGVPSNTVGPTLLFLFWNWSLKIRLLHQRHRNTGAGPELKSGPLSSGFLPKQMKVRNNLNCKDSLVFSTEQRPMLVELDCTALKSKIQTKCSLVINISPFIYIHYIYNYITIYIHKKQCTSLSPYPCSNTSLNCSLASSDNIREVVPSHLILDSFL